jgi:protein-S-isoprenylcysteine O-methyltransferase Ste14
MVMTVSARAAAAGIDRSRGARVVPVPPPLYYAAAFLTGKVLHDATVPLAIGVPPTLTVLGFGILAVGGGLCIAGIVEVVRHRTTIVPHSVVSRLVTTGAYRVSRNPMYTGLTIVYLGATLLSGTWWPLVTLPLALLAVYCLVISPEEHYLAARFGSLYTNYQARTRRWL